MFDFISGYWTSDELVKHGLFDVTENPSMISDLGMLAASQAFPMTKSLMVSNCPHLHYPSAWFRQGMARKYINLYIQKRSFNGSVSSGVVHW